MATTATGMTDTSTAPARIPAAAWYALVLLLLANVLNYLDRQIVSILAQSIKADLKLDDADLGFLLGTAFAVFYSVVGIAMGRISDLFSRKKLMAAGVAVWSVMTALGGTATSFAMLGFARIGVGVGEAVANPCGHSLVADIFPPRNRALALSLLLTGVFIGIAAAMLLGGWFVANWETRCPGMGLGAICALPDWQAALIAVGLPGLPLALLILTIREPARPQQVEGSGITAMLWEFAAAFPPFTLIVLYRLRGLAGVRGNLIFAAALAAAALLLIHLTGDKAQWAAFALGAYAIVTWGQVQNYRDRPLFKLTFGDPTFMMTVGATALIGTIGGTVNVWAAPYAMRTFTAISPIELGGTLAVLGVGGGLAGVLVGGIMADKWRARDRRAPMGMGAITVIGIVPSILVMMAAATPAMFFAAFAATGFFGALWSGSTAALIQDLVLQRMRGSAAACGSLIAIVVGSGTGPYWAGKVSTVTGSLNAGLVSILILAPLALLLLWLTSRRLPGETPEARLARAAAAGEPLPQAVSPLS